MKRLRIWWLGVKLEIGRFDIAMAERQLGRLTQDLRLMKNEQREREAEHFFLQEELLK